MLNLKQGDKAPNFSESAEQEGKTTVLYFYPKDNTPGCTLESCGFNAVLDEFLSLGVQVIGVSRDSLASHVKFKQRYHLKFPLLSDPEGSLCRAYGVLVEKSMLGRKYLGIERSTFLIDEQNIIREIWRKVSVVGHVKSVLEKCKALKSL